MTNDHPYDDIETFALGGLEPERQRIVLEHADACPTCAVLLADAMAGVSALAQFEEPIALTRPAPAVPAGSRSNVRQLPVRRVAPSAWLAAVAVAACLALIAWNVQLRQAAMGVPASVPIAALVHSHFIHHPLAGPAGSAKVIQAVDGHWVGEFGSDGAGAAAQYFDQAPGSITAYVVTAADQTPEKDARALRWP
jgi:anti-sigma factor RsiW